MGTCAGDGKVEIDDMLRLPGTNTPFMFRDDDVCSDVMLYNMCQQTWEMGDLGEAPFFVLWTMRVIACNSRQVGRGLEAWATG